MTQTIKAAVIGVGHVGSHVAASFLSQGLMDEIILIDIDGKKALGHATDLADMMPYLPVRTRVHAGGYGELADASLVIISACGKYFDEDRLSELDDTLRVMDDIIGKLKTSGFSGIVLSISNPCDLVAQYVAQHTGLRVIGTGTMLDSARLRCRLAQALDVSECSVNACCIGEHGDSQVAVFSNATVGNIPLDAYMRGHTNVDLSRIAAATAAAGWDIVKGKGCTEFGIGAATARLAQAILHNERAILPCSTELNGEYGQHGVYTSVPCVIGKNGVERIVEMKLSADEQAAFEKSSAILATHAQCFKANFGTLNRGNGHEN